ncbi:MAG TPA: hypothetical protein VFW19_14510 [Allosphingosinicella sp.]|nr:hypothetical protein [Allosphingosinicella sp.]
MAERQASLLHLSPPRGRGEDAGAHQHRVTNAINLIGDDSGFMAAELSWLAPGAPELALAADILVVHALAAAEIEGLIQERRRRGRVTLFEIGDDLSAPRPWSRHRAGAQRALVVGRQLLHASVSDGVQFSSTALKAKYSLLNPVAAVLDNVVDFPSRVPSRSPGFAIGWGGTRSHLADLEAIAPAIMSFCAEQPRAVFSLMGDESLRVPFAGLSPGQFLWRPFSTYAEYRAFLGTLDVGLAPLADGPFNRGRSDVKPIEMVAEGAAVLVQSAPAFAALPASLPRFEDANGLLALLRKLFAAPAELVALASAAREDLSATRGTRNVREQHLSWYRSRLLTRTGPLRLPPPNDCALRLEDARRHAGTGETEATLAIVHSLIDEMPNYAQARWLGAQLLAGIGRTAEAIALGSPLGACPVHRHVWEPLARALGAYDDSRQCSDPGLLPTRR